MSSTSDDVIPCPLCKQPLEMLLNGRALCRNAGDRQAPSSGCLLWLENAQLHIETWQALHTALRAHEQAVRAEERERAAKVCEGLVTFDPDHEKYTPADADVPCGWCDGLEKAAATIRRDDTAAEREG